MFFYINSKNCVFIFCFIGCIAHLGYEVHHYLKFPVRSQVTIEFPSTIKIPDIDIFLPLVLVLNLNELFNRYPVEMESICRRIGVQNLEDGSEKNFRSKCLEILETSEWDQELANLLTVGDIEQLSPNSSSLITVINLHQDKTISNQKVKPSCKIERHFNAFSLFLRVACRNGSQILSKTISTNSETVEMLVCLQYKFNYSFGFRFASPDDIITGRYGRYQLVHPKSNEKKLILSRFRRTIVHSLEYPYETNCREYHKSRVLQDCIQSNISNSTGSIIYSEKVYPFGRYPSHYKFTSFASKKSKVQLIENCFQLIEAPECHSEWYETIAIVHNVKKDKPSVICLEPQIEFNFVFKAYPEVTFSDLLVYTSSILGIWFGISVYGNWIQLYGKLSVNLDWYKIPVLSVPIFEKRSIQVTEFNNEIAENNEAEIKN